VSIGRGQFWGAYQEAIADPTCFLCPLGFQEFRFFPYSVQRLSRFDRAVPLSFRNHPIPAGKSQDASFRVPPRDGWTAPREPPPAPWRGPDYPCHEESAGESRHTLAHVDQWEASGCGGSARFSTYPGRTAPDARSRTQTPPRSLFHWKGGASPVRPGTASAG